MTGGQVRTWARMLAPIAAWVALAVALSHQPGWAAGAEPSGVAGAREGADRSVVPNGPGAAGTGPGGEAAVDRDAAARAGAQAARPAPGPSNDGQRVPILYVPPNRGQARRTAGAGTRGLAPPRAVAGPRPRVAVLAPSDHVGLTASPSPTLYWVLSASTTIPIEITIVDDDAIEPLLQLRLPGPIDAGLHALALEPLGVELLPHRPYRWFVALVHDPHRRSKDELAEGAIERVAPSAGSPSAPDRAPDSLRRAALRSAEQGLWYDALGALSAAIEQVPDDRSLVADRQALLDQTKLGVALP